MDKYTIYCTKEQTRKTLKLGAPIKTFDVSSIEGKNAYNFPTAEQMIEWLEGQGLIIEIYECNGYYFFAIFHKEGLGSFASRKKATLAAIDAALEYLENKK